jgi:hypothetical protein
MKAIGDQSEQIACQWLRDQGYVVVHTGHRPGPIDIIAIKLGEALLLDVKTNRPKTLTKRQRDLGVKLLVVDRPSGRCRIVTRLPNRPPGSRQFRGHSYGWHRRTTRPLPIHPSESTT